MELDSYDPIPAEEGSSKANVALRKRTIGGMLYKQIQVQLHGKMSSKARLVL